VLCAHLLCAFATVLKPGGAKSLVAGNLLLRQQRLVLRRSRLVAPPNWSSQMIVNGRFRPSAKLIPE